MYPNAEKDMQAIFDCEGQTSIAVIILTLNEAPNLPQALASVKGWAHEIFVLDSFSTDNTVEIASQAGCSVVQNAFVDYAKQRNFAIEQLPIESEWILFLDADEWLTDELKSEISRLIETGPEENGFYIKRRMIWMGKWIRRGYYPSWILRLFRRGKGRCEDRAMNEHLIVEGKPGFLQNDFIHEDQKGIDDWIGKHNRYATHEALELIKREGLQEQEEIKVRFWGTQAERNRWLRYKIFNRMPPLVRPFFYFIYRYLLRGAFLEGRPAFVYHFLQSIWYHLLIDAKYLEMKAAASNKSTSRANK
jgi:glycosyltransferase involved in cell wall biosynthesis